MKKWKWIKIGLISLISIGVITTSLVVLLWNVDEPKALNTYCLNFNKSPSLTQTQQENIDKKNKFIVSLKSEANKIIHDYQKQTNNDQDLIFSFANLTNGQTQGEINYYSALNRTLKEISPSLGIENQQRTPKLINEAFYNKNTEMMTFYWSPDYNSVGTWLKYMFTDTYTMPNMWPATYSLLNKYQTLNAISSLTPEQQQELNNLNQYYPWINSLLTHIKKYNIPGTSIPIFKSPIEILNFIASNDNFNGPKIQIDDYYVNLANIIGRWVNDNSNIKITQQTQLNPATQQNETINIYDPNVPDGIKYVNWIASQNPNIPYQEVGNNASTPYLCSTGLYMPANSNADINFRDWYYYENQFTDSIAKDWWIGDPFQSNETAWNGPFSKAPNSLYAQSVWTSLTSWTTRGDENDNDFKEEHICLVANGITNDITDKNVKTQLENEFNTSNTLTFNIRPIPWVDTNGKATGSYLSPKDFFAGFKAFKRSIDNGINANNAYFIGLAAVDFDRTLNDKNNLETNTSTSSKPFKVYFKDPILNLNDTLDIFQKQYFMAIPYDHPKVQNIIDDTKYNKIAVGDAKNPNYLDIAKTDMTQFYGVGVGYDPAVWGSLWSAAPYYISNVDKQSITYNLNEEYFKAFNDVNTKPEYVSFNLNHQTKNNKNIKKLNKINLKYAGSYNLDILYEQFKANELNKALLQSVNLMDALNQQKQFLRYQKVKKINKSNTIGFNLQIYEKWNEPTEQVPQGYNPAQNIILDQNNQPMWDPKTRKVTYSIDEYGNYQWPKGKQPKIKSNVSNIYKDLIVSDFYTPIFKKGKSSLIRFAIMNTINWVSLKSLVTPGVSSSIQYSFMPYGVYELSNQGSYWDLAANKRYLTNQELEDFTNSSILSRMSGNMIWTYDELLNNMIKAD